MTVASDFTTLPARYYTDPELFQRELESFYGQSWVCAGRADTIPNAGDYFVREVAGENVIVLRDGPGAVRAFYNVCRHRGTRLCSDPEGNLGSRIKCPYHAWTYGLDGRLLGAPHMDGAGCEAFKREDYPLHSVRAAIWDGHIFIHLGTDPEPLENQLTDLPRKFAAWRMEELRLYRRIVYDLNANWKLFIMNYSECLHCPSVHPELNRLTDYLGAVNDPPAPGYIGGAMDFRNGAETMSFDGKKRRDFLPGLDDNERRKVCYYAIYPNLLLSLNPDYMMIHTLWPQAVDRTKILCEFYFHPAEMAKPDFHADDAIEFWDRINRQDWRIVEMSQAGIRSRAYRPGPYSHRETLLHDFDRLVLERERGAK
ncbi:MAG TPA: aromatic ring-hydroxylating dioxygenase subunit alpha [Bryobacteraceae bacterium]|jgi:Rieske 2Fe-2S family protein